MNKKIISIVGSGISGLVCAVKLSKSEFSKIYTIRVFESEEKIGGRVQSIKQDGFSIELGAGRISPSLHPNVCQLIDELKEKIEIFPFTDIAYPHPRHAGLKEKLAELKPLIDSSLNESFFQFLSAHTSEVLAQEMINSLGYDTLHLPQISPKIAYDIIEKHPEIQHFSDNASNEWFNLVNGFSTITKHLYEEAIRSGVEFYFGHKLTNLHIQTTNSRLEFENKAHQEVAQHCAYAILALPPSAMSKIDIDFPNSWSDFSYGSVPLFKGFLIFESPWWKDFGLENKVIIVDNPLRKIYFKGDTHVFFYTDSANADFWHEVSQKEEDQYISVVMSLISKTLNVPVGQLPQPVNHEFKYWPNGVEFVLDESPAHPPVLSKNNGRVVSTSDAYTPHCGWMEGAISAGRSAASHILGSIEKSVMPELVEELD